MTSTPRFFYGWYLVGIALVSGAFQTGVGIWGVSVFVSPMEEDLGWSRASFFLALTIRTGLTGVLSPIVGPWRDTPNGPRMLMLFGSLILGGSLIALRWVDNIWEFYFFFGVLGAVGSLGAGGIVTQTILPKWFIRRRGRALGIASMGGAMGPLFFPISIFAMISLVGWRDAWFILGVASLALLVPLSFMLRTNPEDIGLLPDGDRDPAPGAPSTGGRARPSRVSEVSLTGRQALRSPAFWFIILAFALGGLGQQGFQSNWIPYLEGKGFAAGTAAFAITVYGVFSVSARILWGLLADRFQVRYLIVIQSLLTASSVLLLLYVIGPVMLFAFVFFFGLTMGGSFLLRPLIVANYFGRMHIGAITGYMRPFQATTAALGPVVVALAYDAQGSYFWSFVAVMIGYASTAAVIMLAKPPREQLQRQAAPPQPPERRVAMRAVPSIFYGWRLVGIALVSSAFNAGLGMWGIGVFAFSMEEELGWSRSALFLALTIRTGLTGLLSPIVGPWRDTRNGPRVLMLVGAIILGVSLMSLKYVESLWQFYLFFGVVGAAGSLGAGGMLTQTILPKWFIRRRGIALGIASTGGAMGPLFFPISIIALISLVGWRDAWFMLGAISLVVLIPLSLLVRTNPEDIGLLPDGDKESPDPVPAARRRSGRSAQPRQRGEPDGPAGPQDHLLLAHHSRLRSGRPWAAGLPVQLGPLPGGPGVHRRHSGACPHGLRLLFRERPALVGNLGRPPPGALPPGHPVAHHCVDCPPVDLRDGAANAFRLHGDLWGDHGRRLHDAPAARCQLFRPRAHRRHHRLHAPLPGRDDGHWSLHGRPGLRHLRFLLLGLRRRHGWLRATGGGDHPREAAT